MGNCPIPMAMELGSPLGAMPPDVAERAGPPAPNNLDRMLSMFAEFCWPIVKVARQPAGKLTAYGL